MKHFDDIVDMIDDLNAEDLELWIGSGWVKPEITDNERIFTTTDIARVRLIVECHYDLNIEADSMAVVLSLLDQVYGLRRELGVLMRAIDAQPSDVRKNIARAAVENIDDVHP